MRILVGICSCSSHPGRREAVRETWAAALPPEVGYRFFIGGGGDDPHPDTVVLPVDDSYWGLPAKVVAFMRWALAHAEFEWLFKCDDDTYLHGGRLLEVAREAEGKYGLVGGLTLCWPYRYPSGGAGYLMSREMVERLVASDAVPETGLEDVLIGQAAILRLGAVPWPHAGFVPTPEPAPSPGNRGVTCHDLTPSQLRRLHLAFHPGAALGTALVVLGHGRRACLGRAVASAVRHLRGWEELVVVDDSGDEAHRRWAAGALAPDRLLPVAPEPAGYAAAMARVWEEGRRYPGGIFLLEEDFELIAPVDLADLRRIQERSGAAQVALVRQPWWPNEAAAGGVVREREAAGHVFAEQAHGRLRWLEHRSFFTTNPCYLPPATLRRWEWPEVAMAEAAMGRRIFADPATVCAYLGHRDDPPAVLHDGEHTGFGY